jgi:hypothetical protein
MMKILSRQRYFDWIAESKGFHSIDDWYNVKNAEIIDSNGYFVTFAFKNSHAKALEYTFPEIEWHPWRFANARRGLWKEISECRKFFHWVAEELNVDLVEDWYRIPREKIMSLGGSELIQNHDGSLYKTLKKSFPDTAWQWWRLGRSTGYPENLHMEFVDYLEEKFGIFEKEDWKWTTRYAIFQHIGSQIDYAWNILKNLTYPVEHWDEIGMGDLQKRHQKLLSICVSRWMPKIEVEFEAKLPTMDAEKLRFDVWIPVLNIAFEYQGQQHYLQHDVLHETGDLRIQCERDSKKSKICDESCIELYQIPFWWNHDASTIYEILESLRN